MKKSILVGLVVCSVAFAYQAEVKKQSVTLMVNDIEKSYQSGDKFSLNAGDLVCFTKGDGRVVIKGKQYKKQLTKRSKSCKHLPSEDGTPTDYTKEIKDNVIAMFQRTKEISVDGVSRKDTKSDTLTAPIYIKPSAKYLSVTNSTWGPLPITLQIIDKQGNIVETFINKEDVETSFIIPRGLLQEGYTIKTFNTFDDILVNSKVHLQTN
jgi:hypothetical protein